MLDYGESGWHAFMYAGQKIHVWYQPINDDTPFGISNYVAGGVYVKIFGVNQPVNEILPLQICEALGIYVKNGGIAGLTIDEYLETIF